MDFFCSETWVRVQGLEVIALVGLHAEERSVPQVVVVSVDCRLSIAEVYSDDLAQTSDYAPFVAEIRRLACAHPRRLIETLAEEIAEVCFADPRVSTAVVRVDKPHKLAGCSSVGVTRTFVKGEK